MSKCLPSRRQCLRREQDFLAVSKGTVNWYARDLDRASRVLPSNALARMAAKAITTVQVTGFTAFTVFIGANIQKRQRCTPEARHPLMTAEEKAVELVRAVVDDWPGA